MSLVGTRPILQEERLDIQWDLHILIALAQCFF